MAYNKLSNHATTISAKDGYNVITYHSTDIVKWNEKEIILNSNEYRTVTTKRKMNQASIQFDLRYQVYQVNFEWFVDYKGMTLDFKDKMILTR